MGFENIHTFYFLGIGGIGMSALARYFAANGYQVMGYDRTPSALTKELEIEGIAIQYDDSIDHVQELDKATTIVVRTPAVPEDTMIYVWLRKKGFNIFKRAEVLGMVTRSARALCVAGTHGKTTTSTMLAHILHRSHIGTNAFLGGIANNYKTNLLLDKSQNVVIEADEFDRSFHHLTPYISVITSMDPDHLDIYGTEEAYHDSFERYAELVEHALIIKRGIKLAGKNLKAKVYTYGVNEPADFYADNVQVKDGKICFDFHTPKNIINDIYLGVPAWVNVENGVAAMAISWLMGTTDDELREGVSSFLGVYRRFNIHISTPQITYIDDYAHHPMELQASIESIKLLYPGRCLIGVFQPHLFSRTRDFGEEFAQALSLLDEVILLPIYPARELPIEGITSHWLAQRIYNTKVKAIEKNELTEYLRKRIDNLTSQGKSCVVTTLGAGDIDQLVNNITKTLIV